VEFGWWTGSVRLFQADGPAMAIVSVSNKALFHSVESVLAGKKLGWAFG